MPPVMIPWEHLDSAPVPGSRGEMHLYRRGEEYSICVENEELMNNRLHGSEEALARIACERVSDRPRARVLIGGLGMGYTLAAALAALGADGQVVVAELLPAVISWNRGPLAGLAGRPLDDPRVTVVEDDVARLVRAEPEAWDAIVLDVDNGPEGLTRKANDWLYGRAGLAAAGEALRGRGVLAIWSASSDRAFTRRLRQAGFEVDSLLFPAAGARGGRRHTIWIACPRWRS